MRIVALPGFGDNADYWAELIGQATDAQVTPIRWPGLWGAPEAAGDPIEWFVRAAVAAVDTAVSVGEQVVVVGHSLGARLTLDVASRRPGIPVVLTAPALGELSVVTGERLDRWRRDGVRLTTRKSVTGDADVTVPIPVSYANGLVGRRVGPAPKSASLVVMLSVRLNAATVAFYPDTSTAQLTRVTGPHRWWELEAARGPVLVAVADFVASVTEQP